MKTLGSMRLVKRKRIAQETLAIYCPLSQRLGLYRLWQELQNLCLAQTHHFRFFVLQKIAYERQQKWAKKLEKNLDTLHNSLKNYFFEVSLKPSHKPIAMIYARMKEEKRNFDEVMNLCSYVVIVPDELACYQALGLIHKQFTPLPGRFKDHIAIPKNNGYQSLHTIVMSPYNIPVEFQIRTLAMDQQASWGIILAQKSNENTQQSNSLENSNKSSNSNSGTNSINKISLHGWLDHVLALSNSDLIHSIKEGLASDAVYVLTPKSEVKVLPRGATALDFAFSIHSQIGLHAVKVKIDGYLQPLDTELKNGNHVQIITSKELVNYSLDDLKRLRTSFARQQLKHSLKKQGITHH
jgi:GTP pyrophosphokinase